MGVDSFFEYVLKLYILFFGYEFFNWMVFVCKYRGGIDSDNWLDFNVFFFFLNDVENLVDLFLEVWYLVYVVIKCYFYNEKDYFYYDNVNFWIGFLVFNWVDSLGVYYLGFFVFVGEVEEVIEINFLYIVIWMRYVVFFEWYLFCDKIVEGGFGWWLLWLEFIELIYYIYCVIKDFWYLYVGEMVLWDIMRCCWIFCGWVGL